MQPRPLVAKLAKILAEMDRVPKNGRNAFHKYDYVTESDLVDAVRSRLGEAGIMIIPTVTEASVSGSGKDQITTVALEIALIDGESGDQLTSRWIGQGQDGADKGYYKAYTGAMKYFLLKTFLISTGDDPEADRVQAPKGPARPPERRVATLAQLTEAVLALKPPRGVQARWEAGILKRMQAQSLAELTSDQLAYVIDNLSDHMSRAAAALEAEA